MVLKNRQNLYDSTLAEGGEEREVGKMPTLRATDIEGLVRMVVPL
jgi:hypothetical protein